ncbi:MAG: hypothetical protein GY804_05600 [Alphaproteobacteria bacterium]|nr:hypothetical protein [Alphaproteobacteria bacterium]
MNETAIIERPAQKNKDLKRLEASFEYDSIHAALLLAEANSNEKDIKPDYEKAAEYAYFAATHDAANPSGFEILEKIACLNHDAMPTNMVIEKCRLNKAIDETSKRHRKASEATTAIMNEICCTDYMDSYDKEPIFFQVTKERHVSPSRAIFYTIEKFNEGRYTIHNN